MVNNFYNEDLKKIMDKNKEEGDSNGKGFFSGFIKKRDKDFSDEKPDLKHQREIVYYTFNSYEELLSYKDDIIGVCNALNARFYLYPRRISYKATMFSLFKTMLGAVEINEEAGIIRNINSILQYERPFSIDILENYTLLDYDRKDNVELFRSELKTIIGDRLVADMPTVYGNHFLITNVDNAALEMIKGLEPNQMDIKPDAALLIYYNAVE